MAALYETALARAAESDPRIVVLTAENRAPIRRLPEALGERFVDVGIAEQTLVGAAAGLALRGRLPVAHSLASFLTMRAFEFIRTDVGIANLPVKLIGSVPGLLSEANGPTHQALEDVALMRGVPNMGVFCPADEEDLVLGLPKILQSPGPFYVRLNTLEPVLAHQPSFEIGRAELVLDGSDVGILTYGTLFGEAFAAARLLEANGLSVWLVNLRTLEPIDELAVLEAARATRFLVTIEDHFLRGGLASIVAEILMRDGRPSRTLSIGFPQRWFRPALLPDVLEHEELGGAQIAERIFSAWSVETR
jgi:transketolase